MILALVAFVNLQDIVVTIFATLLMAEQIVSQQELLTMPGSPIRKQLVTSARVRKSPCLY